MEYPEVIVIGAGGIKGYLELGSLLYLETNGLLNKVKSYYGVSIGSLISLLIICGYTIPQIIDNLIDMDFDKKEINPAMLIKSFGILSINGVKNKIIYMIKKKLGKILNLEQLHMATGIDYNSVVSNNTKGEYEFINKDTYPTLDCVSAAFFSMNIPLVFPKIEYNGNVYTDGALTCSFPSLYIDDGTKNILCIHIITRNSPEEKDNILHYLYNSINMLTNQMKNFAVSNASPKCKLLFLYSNEIDMLGVNISIESKAKMFTEGYNLTKEFFSK